MIARIAGHIVSMSLAIGPLTNLFTKHMQKFVEDRISGLKKLTREVEADWFFGNQIYQIIMV